MRKYLLLVAIVLFLSSSHSQDCGNSEITVDLQDRIIRDTIYKKDVEQRIKYFAFLNKEILPKYQDLKTHLQNSIEDEDKAKVKGLKKTYEKKRLYYLSEIRRTQAETFKNVNSYSIINSILLFETLATFPDSYALLYSSPFPKDKDIALANELYLKYSDKLSTRAKCMETMKSEMKEAKTELQIVETFQNEGYKSKEDTLKADIVDFLIWATE